MFKDVAIGVPIPIEFSSTVGHKRSYAGKLFAFVTTGNRFSDFYVGVAQTAEHAQEAALGNERIIDSKTPMRLCLGVRLQSSDGLGEINRVMPSQSMSDEVTRVWTIVTKAILDIRFINSRLDSYLGYGQDAKG